MNGKDVVNQTEAFPVSTGAGSPTLGTQSSFRDDGTIAQVQLYRQVSYR